MTLVCNTWDAGLEQVYRMQPPQTTAGGHSNTCTLRLCLSVQLKELPQLARVNTKRNLPRSITTLANHTWTITPFNNQPSEPKSTCYYCVSVGLEGGITVNYEFLRPLS